MAYEPLKPIEELSAEILNNCSACYEMQDLYWERETCQDPERLAEIDRKLVAYLLKLDEPIEYKGQKVRILDSIGFSQLEMARLRSRRELTSTMRIKLRIYCQDFTCHFVGT